MLECREITVAGRLSAFSAQIVPGCRIHIIGPNGAGKSTLLTRLAGMSAGEARLFSTDNRLPTFPDPGWHVFAPGYASN